ncbi:3'-kinase [Rhizobium sp. Root708]|uniref:aminoglycoside phosphotransferase family protein n=1 Tax=Rhizobium sp. Root708 TaxID=1736592 RepID=UPI0006F43019|nr:aminoglycoside phosphotransferase family protein [Rhizobium sp. Root708]KRB50884.1 3'-kinase [Rhizobium sp. Root708]
MFQPYLDRWQLVPDGSPIITHSSNLLPVLWRDEPAILKIAHDASEMAGGALMKWWDGDGAATVFACSDEAVLLERALGTRSLLTMAMNGEDDEASRIICATVAKLHAPRSKRHPPLIELHEWFRALPPAAQTHDGILSDCDRIAAALLSDPRDRTVLHGDIHHSNILDFGAHGWRAIDPKALLGERGYDYANIFANHDLATLADKSRLRRQLGIVSAAADLDPRRLLQWIAAYSGLSAAWFLGDGATLSAEAPLAVARIAVAELS